MVFSVLVVYVSLRGFHVTYGCGIRSYRNAVVWKHTEHSAIVNSYNVLSVCVFDELD